MSRPQRPVFAAASESLFARDSAPGARDGCNALKDRLEKLLGRIRGDARARWPWSRQANADRGAALPPHGLTGWTVHRDVALRLKGLEFEPPAAPLDERRGDNGAFKIRLAGSHESHRAASLLVQQRYAKRGYRASTTHANPNLWTFAAYDEGHLAGTISLRLDSADGVAADGLYRAEIDAIRRDRHRVCEFTRLALNAKRRSQPVLAGLFHTVYLFAWRVRNFDYVVIEVNPRHVGFYSRSLGFDVIGSERHNPRVDAPAVLMGISFADIAHHLHRHTAMAKRTPRVRSLYAYGFSPAEEAGVLGRLRTLEAAPSTNAGYPN